jgi:3-oxoacyl-[acyl-carrier protein] reductase
MTYPDLRGKTAIVTGGSRGLGSALCIGLAGHGARVVVCARDPIGVAHTVDRIRWDGGTAIGIVADCTKENEVERLRQASEEAFGPPELLAVFAGGSGEPTPTLETPMNHWNAVIETNLSTTFLVLRNFLPAMCAQGRGAVVTMSSAAARQPAKSSAAYAAAKGAIISLTRHIAAEFAPSGVRVNCLAPSAILTDRLAAAPQRARDELAATFPLGRLGHPGDVTGAALYLLSDASAWITGATLDIAGGKIFS